MNKVNFYAFIPECLFVLEKKKVLYSPKVLNYEMSYKYKVELSCSFLYTVVIFSLLAFGLRGASVSRTGCSSGAMRNSL